jgi:hypothetical protein
MQQDTAFTSRSSSTLEHARNKELQELLKQTLWTAAQLAVFTKQAIERILLHSEV